MGIVDRLEGGSVADDHRTISQLVEKVFGDELPTNIGLRVLALSGMTHPDIQKIIDEEKDRLSGVPQSISLSE